MQFDSSTRATLRGDMRANTLNRHVNLQRARRCQSLDFGALVDTLQYEAMRFEDKDLVAPKIGKEEGVPCSQS